MDTSYELLELYEKHELPSGSKSCLAIERIVERVKFRGYAKPLDVARVKKIIMASNTMVALERQTRERQTRYESAY